MRSTTDKTYTDNLIIGDESNNQGMEFAGNALQISADYNNLFDIILNSGKGFFVNFSDKVSDSSSSKISALGLSLLDTANTWVTVTGHGIGFASFCSAAAATYNKQEWAIFTFKRANGASNVSINIIHSSTNVSTTAGQINSFNISGNANNIVFTNRLGTDGGTEGEGFAFCISNDIEEGA